VNIAPQDSQLVRDARDLLTAPDKVLAYQEHLDDIWEVYQTLNVDEASARLRAVHQAAYDPVEDSSALRQLHSALRNHVFEFGDNLGSLGGAHQGEFPTVHIWYVNGILTTSVGAANAVGGLRALAEERGLSQPVRWKLFYNSSFLEDPSSGKSMCVFAKLDRLAGVPFTRSEQILHLINFLPSGPDSTAIALADSILRDGETGVSMVLVGHSQGTLMIQEALETLGVPDPCVASISLAGPLGQGTWPAVETELDGFVVAGERAKDIILRLNANDFDQVATNISQDFDWAIIDYESVGWAPLVVAGLNLMYDGKLHSMLNSYIAGDNSSSRIVELLNDALQGFQEDSECSPSAGSLTVHAITSGTGSDIDGYRVNLDQVLWEDIDVIGSVTISDVPPGEHVVTLEDVAPNCAVEGENPRSVIVPPGGVAETTFNVQCVDAKSPVAIAAGQTHTCAVSADARGYCWGNASGGALGNGATAGSFSAPDSVRGGLAFVSIVTGSGHSCGLTTDSLAYCWGLNNWGQLGIGTTGHQRWRATYVRHHVRRHGVLLGQRCLWSTR
jgi:hypothetical protein